VESCGRDPDSGRSTPAARWHSSPGPWCAAAVHVSPGQKAKYSLRAHIVCFAPESGLKTDIAGGPFRASFRLMHRSKRHPYSSRPSITINLKTARLYVAAQGSLPLRQSKPFGVDLAREEIDSPSRWYPRLPDSVADERLSLFFEDRDVSTQGADYECRRGQSDSWA
jgi:hypothetical protein